MDPTNPPTPTATTATATTSTDRPRQVLNRRHLQEIANSRQVVNAALDPANVGPLTAVELDSALVKKLDDRTTETEKLVQKLPGVRAGKLDMTHEEKIARDALIAVIAPIQTAAKRRYMGAEIKMRAAYFIGHDLHNEALSEVTAAAKSIYTRLTPGENNAPPVDTLPGVKDDKIQALKDAIDLYVGKDAGQQADGFDAFKILETVVHNVTEMVHMRHQVQLAADQAFPHRDPLVTTIRKTFLLPTNQPLPDWHL